MLWAVLATGGVLLARGLARGVYLGVWRTADTLVIAYMTLLILSFLFSVDWEQSLWGERFQRQGLLTGLLYVGFYFLARFSISDMTRLLLWLRLSAIGATVVALYGVAQKLGMDPIWSLQDVRVFSTIGQPNALGAYLGMLTPTTAALAVMSESSSSRAGWSAALLAQLAALVLTLSRGAYLAVAIAGAFFLQALLRSRSDARRLLIRFVVAAVVAVSLLAFFPSMRAAGNRVVDRAAASIDPAEPSARGHLDMWTAGWHIAIDNPLLGTGPDTFALEFPAYRDQHLPPERVQVFLPYRVESPHNVYLATAVGSGLFAVVVYLAIVIATLLGLKRTVWSLPIAGLAGGVLAHLIADAFMTAEVTGSWLFWMMLGVLSAQPFRNNGDQINRNRDQLA